MEDKLVNEEKQKFDVNKSQAQFYRSLRDGEQTHIPTTKTIVNQLWCALPQSSDIDQVYKSQCGRASKRLNSLGIASSDASMQMMQSGGWNELRNLSAINLETAGVRDTMTAQPNSHRVINNRRVISQETER